MAERCCSCGGDLDYPNYVNRRRVCGDCYSVLSGRGDPFNERLGEVPVEIRVGVTLALLVALVLGAVSAVLV